MKARFTLLRNLVIGSIIYFFSSAPVFSQAEESNWNVSADLVSRYVWRGTDFGNAPAVQPALEFGAGNFVIGSWGSYTMNGNSYLEVDLYAGYSFNFGLDVNITDYYFPSAQFGSVTDNSYFKSGYHTIEIGLNQALGNFYVSGYYFMNADSDLYFETGYSFENVSLFAGLGNKSYTNSGDFNLCNIGLSATKEIPFTEKFSLPVMGAFIVNPDKHQAHLVFGFSF